MGKRDGRKRVSEEEGERGERGMRKREGVRDGGREGGEGEGPTFLFVVLVVPRLYRANKVTDFSFSPKTTARKSSITERII